MKRIVLIATAVALLSTLACRKPMDVTESASLPIVTPPVTAEDDDPSGVIVEDFTPAPRAWEPYDLSIDFSELPESLLEKVKLTYKNAGIKEWYPKQILTLMGRLPENVPNITLEQVKSVCEELKTEGYDSFDGLEYECQLRFNRFAGAPDFDGGSGTTRVVYYLNADGSEYVIVWRGRVEYVNSQGEETLIYSVTDTN